MYGGRLVKNIKKCDFCLEKNDLSLEREGSIPVLHIKFIYDSIYKLEMVPIKKYVIGKIEIDEDDKESEDDEESENEDNGMDSIESIINDIEEDLF